MEECVITGQMNKIELWEKKSWDNKYKDVDITNMFETISNQFSELNI